jgi:hypothetical protein
MPLGVLRAGPGELLEPEERRGPDSYEGQPGAGQPDETDDCQGYDPCITPGPDVDCAGGSGNGPRYVDGPVSVDGSDPYGLDSNYDGVGCET